MLQAATEVIVGEEAKHRNDVSDGRRSRGIDMAMGPGELLGNERWFRGYCRGSAPFLMVILVSCWSGQKWGVFRKSAYGGLLG